MQKMVTSLNGVYGPHVLQLVGLEAAPELVLVPVLPRVLMEMTALISGAALRQSNATLQVAQVGHVETCIVYTLQLSLWYSNLHNKLT